MSEGEEDEAKKKVVATEGEKRWRLIYLLHVLCRLSDVVDALDDDYYVAPLE